MMKNDDNIVVLEDIERSKYALDGSMSLSVVIFITDQNNARPECDIFRRFILHSQQNKTKYMATVTHRNKRTHVSGITY